MDIKYSFTGSIPGYGCRLWVLSDWGDYQNSFDKNEKLKGILDRNSMWLGYPSLSWPLMRSRRGDGSYRVYIKAWEFDPNQWNEKSLISLLEKEGFSVEKLPSHDWDSFCEKGNCT